jgi:hypothetical protein
LQNVNEVLPSNTANFTRQSYVPKAVPSGSQSQAVGQVQKQNAMEPRVVDTLMAGTEIDEQEGRITS